MMHGWNKGPAIWFPPPRAGLAAQQTLPRSVPGSLRIGRYIRRPVAPWNEMIMSARMPARGGLGVECQEAKRHGRGRKFQALEKDRNFGPGWPQGALRRPRARAPFRL